MSINSDNHKSFLFSLTWCSKTRSLGSSSTLSTTSLWERTLPPKFWRTQKAGLKSRLQQKQPKYPYEGKDLKSKDISVLSFNISHGQVLFCDTDDLYLFTSGFLPRVRARALRAPVFLSLLLPQTGALRAPSPSPIALIFLFNPQKYIKSIELGPPTASAFFFPLDHRGYEIWGPLPSTPDRSFADPSGNILGSKLCTGATIRPNLFRFFLFPFVLDLFFLLFSSFSSDLFLFFS